MLRAPSAAAAHRSHHLHLRRRRPVVSSASTPPLPPPSRRHLLAAAPVLAAAAGPAALGMAAAASAPAAAAPGVPRVDLAPGLPVSRIIKGCWQLSGAHRGAAGSDRTSGQAAVDDFAPFVSAGVTAFDTADIYGPSEKLIGKYLAANAAAAAAADVRVLTKFCCFGPACDAAADARYVEGCIDKSRRNLGVDALDLVQFYWHDYANKNYVAAAQHLAALQAKGKIRHVGVTNFDVPRLREIVDAGVKVVSHQVQYSLLDRRPENGMAEYCAAHGIALLPYGTVAGGFLTDAYLGVDAKDVAIDTASKSKYAAVINRAGGWGALQGLLAALAAVGARRGASVADVAARWVLGRPGVAAVIVGARNAAHVGDLARAFAFELGADDLAQIDEALAKCVRPASDCYTWERGGEW